MTGAAVADSPVPGAAAVGGITATSAGVTELGATEGGAPADGGITAAIAGAIELAGATEGGAPADIATEGGAPADGGAAGAVSSDASGQQRHHGTTALQHYPTHPHPRGYVAYRADPAPSINGRLDEACWGAAPWSDDFVDIEGPAKVCVCMPHVLHGGSCVRIPGGPREKQAVYCCRTACDCAPKRPSP